jgi:hypothetical protein
VIPYSATCDLWSSRGAHVGFRIGASQILMIGESSARHAEGAVYFVGLVVDGVRRSSAGVDADRIGLPPVGQNRPSAARASFLKGLGRASRLPGARSSQCRQNTITADQARLGPRAEPDQPLRGPHHNQACGGISEDGGAAGVAFFRLAGARLAADFLAADFLAGLFFAAVFLAAYFFAAPFFTAPLRTAFFATTLRAPFFAAAFFAGFFLTADFFVAFLTAAFAMCVVPR